MHRIRVKICGLTDPETAQAAASAGAAYIGLVFFSPSPRYVAPAQAARIAHALPPGVAKVGLFVNATIAEISAVLAQVPLDMLQLQGEETPETLVELRQVTGLPVMKAVGLATAADLVRLPEFEAVADQILVDAKAPKDAARPGGNGRRFDWSLVAGRRWARPWMLAGGLTPDTVARAVAQTGARQVDVSSGVETAPGCKDPAAIRAFLAALTP